MAGEGGSRSETGEGLLERASGPHPPIAEAMGPSLSRNAGEGFCFQETPHADRRFADPHLGAGHAERGASAGVVLHRRGGAARHGRRRGRRRGDPPAGLGPEFEPGRDRGGAEIPEPSRDPRPFPARQAGKPRPRRPLEGPAGDARAALHLHAAASAHLAERRHDGLAVAGGRQGRAAGRASPPARSCRPGADRDGAIPTPS